MSTSATPSSRGRTWFQAFTNGGKLIDTKLGSVLVADAPLAGETVRLLAIVPDPQNRFPRARHGELGLEEGWALASHVRDAIAADSAGIKRPIIAIVDVQSQAYGRLEALLGIHLSLAAAADAYATAQPYREAFSGMAIRPIACWRWMIPESLSRQCASKPPHASRAGRWKNSTNSAKPSFRWRTTFGSLPSSGCCMS